MKFRVSLDGKLSSSSGDIDQAARDALALAMQELNKLGARNASINLNSRTGAITISCAVEAVDGDLAVQPASDNIRLALHTGEIGTSTWPEPTDPHWRVEFINSRSDAVLVNQQGA
jgi:hypothetical protein